LKLQLIKLLLTSSFFLYTSLANATFESADSNSHLDTAADFCMVCEISASVNRMNAAQTAQNERDPSLFEKAEQSVQSGLGQVLELSRDTLAAALHFIEDNPISRKISQAARSVTSAMSSARCWHEVKAILVKAKLVKAGSLTTAFARQADKELESKGFINLMGPGQPLAEINDPCMAPPGAVLVYEGGPKKLFNHLTGRRESICGAEACGHVEVKVGAVGVSDFASDFRSNHPVTGSCTAEGKNGYRLKAIMVAPGVLPEESNSSVSMSRMAEMDAVQ